MIENLSPWIVYDCCKVPNEFRCQICGEKMVIESPLRYSTLIVIGEEFARKHTHARDVESKVRS